MTRTQIQLPDELYRRAKALAEQKELSLAEIARRGIELFLARFPQPIAEPQKWVLPKVSAGRALVPLDKLRDISSEEESMRGLDQS
ncbi:antitoxin [Prosthecobacter dejongeii]|uniref:Putative transcriptional regulator n=1 Tax=Prosthecobacter dejongeii TaxID=48465 RepID=A0A7W7YID9_9BACT|nr:antitoxin [Prosthecobacter dejongeii]MBB5036704.1 putative transcriptional regulator [Prosthecobacter dejongeii]